MNAVRKLAQEYVHVATTVYTQQEDAPEEVAIPIEEEDVALVAEGEDGQNPTTRIEEEDNAVHQCELDADSVGDSNKGTTEPRLESDEAGDHAQRIITIAKEGSDVMESDAGDGVVNDMLVPFNTLGQENVDYWFGSDADDEVVCEVVAEENIAEKGNNEPFRVMIRLLLVRACCTKRMMIGWDPMPTMKFYANKSRRRMRQKCAIPAQLN